MTPEERQLLTTLADRVRNTPVQQKDIEADQFLRQLSQERPDTAYILAQTVLMQDFALRNAQAQIEDLRRQNQTQPPAQSGSGSFLGGLFGGGSHEAPQQYSGSVPRVNPWEGPSQGRPYGDYPPPPGAGYPGPAPGGPTMQPSQTSGFLRSAASTAAGIAGGALLFQGINSLFSGHGSLMGGSLSGVTPPRSLSETAAVSDHSGDRAHSGGEDPTSAGQEATNAAYGEDRGGGDPGSMDAGYDSDDDDGFGGGDFA
jgi:uncharacterized protein